jgi:hypothetical protein
MFVRKKISPFGLDLPRFSQPFVPGDSRSKFGSELSS